MHCGEEVRPMRHKILSLTFDLWPLLSPRCLYMCGWAAGEIPQVSPSSSVGLAAMLLPQAPCSMLLSLLALSGLSSVSGHGYLAEPPARNAMWR